MTKKDHLFEVDDIARSVLLGHTIKSACGKERQYTREDIDVLEYGNTCAECVAAAAGKFTPEPMSILPKLGWLAIVERAWKYRYEDSRVVSYTVSTSNSGTNLYYKWDKK